ncbi:unnamed protein product [Orchesella dallaii]|uniref:Cyclic nucleotide-binding domain-containing protein n=1 Tax=Orchesella dallaii TaxID=48710 RepID=A0ABP1PNC0_9HEXA
MSASLGSPDGPDGPSSEVETAEMKSSVKVIGNDNDKDEQKHDDVDHNDELSKESHIPSMSTSASQSQSDSSGRVSSSRQRAAGSSSTRGFSMPTISIEEVPPLPIPISEEIFSVDEPKNREKDKSRSEEEKQEQADYSNNNSPKNSWDMTLAQVESLPIDEEKPKSPGESVPVQVHFFKEVESSSKIDEILNGTSKPFKRRIDSCSERRHRRKSPRNFKKALSEDGKLNEVQAEDLEKRLRALAAAFSARTRKTKEKIQQPPTPSSDEDESDELKLGEPTLLDRLRQLASPDPSEFGDLRRKSIQDRVKGRCLKNLGYIVSLIKCDYIFDPQSWTYVTWLLIVSTAFIYNAWVIPLRVVFPYQTESNTTLWIIFDSIADVVYLIDMLIFKPHVKFIQHGFWIDIIALFPADIVVNFIDKNVPLLRLPRFLKVETFWELFRRLDTVLANPHRARIGNSCLYMLYMIHCFACSYYFLSTWEGIGATTWTFDGHGNAYIRCFYFATKTATSIGKNPKPENELEYMFMTFAWLSGVFAFSVLIGQIRDIIATATKSQTEYRILTSSTVSYLHRLGVPNRLQRRVKRWLSYTWEQQKTLDETRILSLLPKNMKAEIALNIHVETLAKVKLFQNCETAFLRDLVVKLRSIIILPGDFVCRKGEIGREMFIVKSGKIQVIGGACGTQVLASLGEGSVFGEIALLGIGGMNKRTADVRAAGFVNLFVLSKADLNAAIRDYPEAQEEMRRKAKKLMKEKIKKERATPSPAEDATGEPISRQGSQVIIKNKAEAPQLIATMMKLFPPNTKIGRYLTQGSKINSPNSKLPNDPDDMVYTSFTSYPPSPFIPGSPGHISQDLDISLMTGDSSDKLFSPPSPLESCCSCSASELTSSEVDCIDDDDDYNNAATSKPNQNHVGEAIRSGFKEECNGKDEDENEENDQDKNSREMSSLYPRCQSPLPPFLRNDEFPIVARRRGSFLPDVVGGLPTHFHKFSSQANNEDGVKVMHSGIPPESGTNREEIPVELRPPLYIIEPSHFDEDANLSSQLFGRRASKDSKEVARKSSQVKVTNETENKSSIPISSAPTTTSTSTSAASPTVASSSTSVLIASHFIAKTRGQLERQMEVDINLPISKKEKRQKKKLLTAGSFSPSLDFDSD